MSVAGQAVVGGQPPPVTFSHTKGLPALLDEVARAAERALGGGAYNAWLGRYEEALRKLGPAGAEGLETLQATTVWRLVVGFGTNPALESGLVLHPLLGFPYLPGSAVRGLVRHVAEMSLLDGLPGWAESPGTMAPPEELERFLAEAERLKGILGSLSVEQGKTGGEGEAAEPPACGPATPRTLLAAWRREGGLGKEARKRVDTLLDRHTGGLVTFYDAVPAAGEEKLLETDILNPHYPKYYDGKGAVAPSDDQDPRPVHFLAVRPGAQFLFSWRVAPLPRSPRGEEDERTAWLTGESRSSVGERIRGWLKAGLETWGAGGKTAAGYGYFALESSSKKGKKHA